MAKQINVDTTLDLLEYNGVSISFELLEALTNTSRPGVWFRVEREGNHVMVLTKLEEQV